MANHANYVNYVMMRAALSVSLVALVLGCTRANPAYRGPSDGASPPFDVIDSATDSATDAATDAGDASSDARGDGPRDTGRDSGGDLPGDANPDNPLACVVAMDCATRNGPPPCATGTWVCTNGACLVSCPNCTDGDRDGYGVGAGCAGPDCDDSNPLIHNTGVRSCYAGPAGTERKGVCRAGSQSCGNGVWTTCAGQVIPSGEACNGEDDDCNDLVDDGLPTTLTCGTGACANAVPSCTAGVVGACVPHAAADHDACDLVTPVDNDCDGQTDEECPATRDACVHVSPDGDDSTGDGTTGSPFRTIQPAIAAAAITSKTVCVAGGLRCDDRTTYTFSDIFQMANGVSVYGNYQSTSWLPCALDPTAPDPHVTLDLREAGGVRFPPSVVTATTLDSFVLTRASGGGITTSSAVTVNGAQLVRLSNLVVNDTPSVTNSYGVNLVNGGQALITRSYISGGDGSSESFGIRSTGNSKPTVRENCSAIDSTTGRCTSDCASSPGLGIFGRTISSTDGLSTAVHLMNSPGASIETSTLCSTESDQAVGVRIIGNATGTVIRGNMITAEAGVTDSVGVWTEDCAEAAPWIVANEAIQGRGGELAVGVLGMGGCHPVIDGNILISVSGDGTTAEADGVLCQTNANSEASLCAVLGNDMIRGSDNLSPTISAGVACKDSSCARVADNVVLGNEGGSAIGVWLHDDGVTVERNRITGGCARVTAAGVLAEDSFARLQNNVISGGTCPPSLSSATNSIGVRVLNADGQNEMDIHSNSIDGGGNSGQCNSLGIDWSVVPQMAPTTSKGIVRNNILHAGLCNTRSDFFEGALAADPRLFENNDLDPSGPAVLYTNETALPLRDIATVNMLPGASNNISANPMYVSFPTDQHLLPGSACIGAGTITGAPATDFDKKKRAATGTATGTMKPTIGAYE